MTRQCKHFTAEQKAAIVRRHLVEGKSVADVCDEQGLQPTVFYRWQKQVFESLPALFERKNDKGQRALEDEVQRLRRTLARKDEIIAEVTGELIDAKKLWGPLMRHWIVPGIRDDVVATVETCARRGAGPLSLACYRDGFLCVADNVTGGALAKRLRGRAWGGVIRRAARYSGETASSCFDSAP